MLLSKGRKFFEGKKRKGRDKTKGLFVEAYAVAPAPSRDYYALQLYQKKFIWTRWKISQKPYMPPLQSTVTLDEFRRDSSLQNELTYIFGSDVTSLITDIASEVWSLVSMPSNIIQKVLSYLSVPDILRMSQVCKRLSKECCSNELWKSICKKQWKILIHNDVEKASLIGWKNLYVEKMKPKKYNKSDHGHPPKPNLHPRNRILSISSLNSPDSRVSTPISISSFGHKKVLEPKKTSTSKSYSEIFWKDFKVASSSVKTATTPGNIIKGRPPFKSIDQRPTTSGRLPSTPKSYFQKSMNLVHLIVPPDNTKKTELSSSEATKTIKSKVISIKARATTSTSQIIQPTEMRIAKPKTDNIKSISRPSTGKYSAKRK